VHTHETSTRMSCVLPTLPRTYPHACPRKKKERTERGGRRNSRSGRSGTATEVPAMQSFQVLLPIASSRQRSLSAKRASQLRLVPLDVSLTDARSPYVSPGWCCVSGLSVIGLVPGASCLLEQSRRMPASSKRVASSEALRLQSCRRSRGLGRRAQRVRRRLGQVEEIGDQTGWPGVAVEV
jgi:hypothetical protein